MPENAQPRSVEANVPFDVAYRNYKKFEEYPKILPGLIKVEAIGPGRFRWTYEAAGQQDSLETEIADDRPPRSVSLRLVSEWDHSWTTSFEALSENRCKITQSSIGISAPSGSAPVDAQVLAGMSSAFLPQFKNYLESQVA